MIHFDLAGLREKQKALTDISEKEEFWTDRENATKVLKDKKIIEDRIKEYEALSSLLDDVEVLIEMAEEEDDVSLVDEITETFSGATEKVEAFRIKTLLNGQYDNNTAIISIHAGSGGTDAQDWASMLLRMYTRWCEGREYKVQLVDLQDDVEAGIKSATLRVEGEYAYGYLKNEKGVHRLVRISPFDANKRRHTSFASLEVMPEINDDDELVIDMEEVRVDTYRSSGAGGQHVNKTDSAVRMTHLPTGIVVQCQNERSQIQNREKCLKMLKSKLIEKKEREMQEQLSNIKGNLKKIEWGSQIRSYVFCPYTLVKDHRTGYENSNIQAVMDGQIDEFIIEYLKRS